MVKSVICCDLCEEVICENTAEELQVAVKDREVFEVGERLVCAPCVDAKERGLTWRQDMKRWVGK